MNQIIKDCSCGTAPEIKEGYDTLYIICPNCKKKTHTYFGDYYDESFMMAAYGDEVIEEWNNAV